MPRPEDSTLHHSCLTSPSAMPTRPRRLGRRGAIPPQPIRPAAAAHTRLLPFDDAQGAVGSEGTSAGGPCEPRYVGAGDCRALASFLLFPSGMRTTPFVPIAIGIGIAIVGAMGAGCTAEVTSEPAYAPAPPPPAPVAEEEIVYDVEPPVVDIEAYPSAVYGGVTVYYVGGVWYRRGPSGWGRYRVEPPGLARVRVAHAHETHWARQGQPRPAPGAAELQRRGRPAPAHREERR